MSPLGNLPALTDVQWQIMNFIWDSDEATVAEVWKHLSESRRVARNTVQTQISRLAEKGWLKHREENGAFFYRPTMSREKSQQSSVRRLIATVFDGSSEGLLLALLNDSKLSKAEADRIRQFLSEAKKRKS